MRSRWCRRMPPPIAEQAVAHASTLFAQGATVVLKIMSRDIVHKSDVGGVVLNLTSAEAVRAATADILARAKAMRPEARISGVIVQAMVVRPKARELILGLADDPTFGTSSCSAAAARRSRSSTTRRWRFRRWICNWRAT